MKITLVLSVLSVFWGAANCQKLTCATYDCQPNYYCVMQAGRPRCVERPKLTCATVKCRGGWTCEEVGGRPKCIEPPKLTCANTLCIEGTTCLMRDGRPVCEKNEPKCPATLCLTGTVCVEPGRCVPVSRTKRDGSRCGGGRCAADELCVDGKCQHV